MTANVTSVILNGKSGDPSLVSDWIRALNDERVVQEKAGFLFKACFDADRLLLEVAPFFIHGERTYHYNMHLEKEDAYTLIGMVDAQGVFTLLFKPESPTLSADQREAYARVCRRFAAFMLEAGYTGKGLLDEITQSLLVELGVSPAPASLAELPGHPLKPAPSSESSRTPPPASGS